MFCKVQDTLCLHKIIAIEENQYHIRNNKGKINGWTTREQSYGTLDKIVAQNKKGSYL